MDLKRYQQAPTEVAAQLATDLENGLQPAEVKQRQSQYGANSLSEQKIPAWYKSLLVSLKI